MTELFDRLSANQRRSQLIAAASEVFILRGYHMATVREISRRAGVTKPLIYRHFSSKLDLYQTVLQNHLDDLVAGVRSALHSFSDNHSRTRAVVQAYFDFVDHESQGFRMIFESGMTAEPTIQWRLSQAHEACVDAVFEGLAEASAVAPLHARVLAAGLVGASEVTARAWLEDGRPVSKTEAVDTVVFLCWSGLSEVSRGLRIQH